MPVPERLVGLGLGRWLAEQWDDLGRPEPVGRVSRLDRGWCTVLTEPEPEPGPEPAAASAATDPAEHDGGRAADEGGNAEGERDASDAPTPDGGDVRRARTFGQVAVGDWVVLSDDGERVDQVLPRASALVRRASFEGARAREHVVAANVDVVFLVHALSSPPNQRRLERELVLVYESGADPVIVLTKADLSEDTAAAVAAVNEVSLGVPVHAVSARVGLGVDGVREYASDHRSIAVIGASGAGKSTLVNALIGHQRQQTADVREGDQRGRHTTVATELVPMPGGGFLIDTPGLRAVSLWSSDEDTPHGLDRAFADVVTLAEGCRFRNCAHDREPGCAVRAAIAEGRLAAERLVSWTRLSAELAALEQESIEVEREAKKGRRAPRRSGRNGPPS